ncbi:MAG: NAD-dependent malic enzyme [Nitrospirae bacterium]|nr:MAG: NAD-dependent malic enzyme [Nitrospirota bacterium]
MIRTPSPGYSITIRIGIDNRIGMFARVATAISQAGGDLGSVDIVRVEKGRIIRDVTVNARDEEHEREIVKAVRKIPGIKVHRVMDRTFSAHKGGKIEVRSKLPVRDRNELSKVYTPGVARICMDIHKNRDHVYRYTMKGNSVAIVTDGTAVLGLGNIGPEAALPVMEGKSMLFKEFANIDAVPIILGTNDTEQIIQTVRNIAPTFGGINLEDISAPRCFEIENRLREILDIPVFHDDQHGTAVVVLGALINVGRLFRKNIKRFKVVILGAGAAGLATAMLLVESGVRNIIVCDRLGTIYRGRRKHMNPYKKKIATVTNPDGIKGTLRDALKGADVLIGLSGPDTVTVEDIKQMSKNPVVFALANPDPEISPQEALPHVRVLATGRSDYPNQINNMLSFPGIFRGLLDVRARCVNYKIKIAAGHAIANVISDEELHEDYIIPSIFDRGVVHAVSTAVAETARKTGVARE